jgi:hypothetical protein
MIWHERFGHLGEQNLKLLIQKILTTKMDPNLTTNLLFVWVVLIGSNAKIHSKKEIPRKYGKVLWSWSTHICANQ